MSCRNHKVWWRPALVLVLLILSREICGGASTLDQLLVDQLDMGLVRTHDLQPQASAHELILLPNSLEFEFPRTPMANIANHEVAIFNNHPNETVYLNSLFALPLEDGQHNDFHVPFVRNQAIAPQANFTFTVVYLPTRIGPVQTEILLRTTFGQLKYQVKGVGIASPFKLVPLTHLVSYAGASAVNSAIIPDITLYNPFDAPIQITEIFSSGGKFYLELPPSHDAASDTGTTSTPASTAESADRAQLWTIAAYEKRAVIRLRFVGSAVAGNYSAYIRMKVRSQDELAEEIILVIPIRMEVRAVQGISLYPEKSLIDLGSVLMNERRPLSINIHTADTPDIGVASVAWESELAIGEITTRFRRILDCSDIVVGEELHVRLKIECDLEWAEVIRNVSQRWDAFVPGAVVLVSGGVTVNSTVGAQKSPQVHRIPLFAELIPGSGLELPQNLTVLFPKSDQASIGIFYLRNNFETAIVVTGIKVVGGVSHPAYAVVSQHLQSAAASDFPQVLRPGESWTVAPIDLPMPVATVGGKGSVLRSFSAHVQISTNVTDVLHVPLYAYSGRLTKLVLSNEVRSLISGKGAGKGGARDALRESEMVAEENAELLDFGSVRLDVEAHKYLALLNDNPVPVELLKWSLPAMDLLVSIYHVGCMNKYDLAPNKDSQLQPDDWCVFSFAATTDRAGEYNGTFQYQTTHESNHVPIRIAGNAGTLFIDPSSLVMRNCFPKTICAVDINVESTYTETVYLHDIVTHKETSVHVFTTEILPHTVTKVGLMYFNPRLNRIEPPGYTNGYSNHIFDNTNADGLLVLQRTAISMFRVLQERQFLLALQLTTDRQSLSASVSVNFIWPRLIARRDSLTERVVMVGQEFYYNISLLNPSDETIGYWYFLTDDRPFISHLSQSPLPDCDDALFRLLGHRVLSTPFGGKGTQKMVLGPGEYRNITIRVSGSAEAGSYASMFVLKNNFTFFEGAWQRVKIVQPQFKFGNRKPFSTTPLLFEVLDQPHACPEAAGGGREGRPHHHHHSVVSTKRVLTAKNSGSLPLAVKGIAINGEPCSGFGFVVLNCAPFELAPNETHKIEISFVPDFTVSRVERKIDFYTDVDFPIQYTLVGVVPQPMLERCRGAVNRPWWEASLKKWALSMLGTMTVIVATVAFFESMKILKDHYDASYRQRGPLQAPLDFKKLSAMKPHTTTAVDGPTKESPKAPPKKKTTPSSSTSSSSSILFNSKRFSWFINRSQQAAAAAAASTTAATASYQTDVQGTTAKGDGTGIASLSKQPTKNNNGPKVSDQRPASRSRPVNGNDTKCATNVEMGSSKKQALNVTKKETPAAAPAKKTKGKGKNTTPAKPVEPEKKVEPKVNFVEQKVVEIAAEPMYELVQPKKSVSLDTAVSSLSMAAVPPPPQLATTMLPAENCFVPVKEPSPVSAAYGKTPGRERKEKQQGAAKRNPVLSARSNKVPLFQQTPNNGNHVLAPPTDPWTSACRGLFQTQPDTTNYLPMGHAYAPADPFTPPPRFDPNNTFNDLPRDVSGLSNGHGLSEELNGFPENPLGAIGTMPPVPKNYSLFDTENRNPMMQPQQQPHSYANVGTVQNSSGYYTNGYGNAQNYAMASSASQDAITSTHSNGYGYNMDMFDNHAPRSSHQLYAEYQYQKQELQRLALLLAINQAQSSAMGAVEPQPPIMSHNTHNNEYMAWDQLQQQQQQQLPRPQFGGGRTGGPPPGMAPRVENADPNNSSGNGDAPNQYDPFRSIWNQWNSNQ